MRAGSRGDGCRRVADGDCLVLGLAPRARRFARRLCGRVDERGTRRTCGRAYRLLAGVHRDLASLGRGLGMAATEQADDRRLRCRRLSGRWWRAGWGRRRRGRGGPDDVLGQAALAVGQVGNRGGVVVVGRGHREVAREKASSNDACLAILIERDPVEHRRPVYEELDAPERSDARGLVDGGDDGHLATRGGRVGRRSE
jgi:hypothetical protein